MLKHTLKIHKLVVGRGNIFLNIYRERERKPQVTTREMRNLKYVLKKARKQTGKKWTTLIEGSLWRNIIHRTGGWNSCVWDGLFVCVTSVCCTHSHTSCRLISSGNCLFRKQCYGISRKVLLMLSVLILGLVYILCLFPIKMWTLLYFHCLKFVSLTLVPFLSNYFKMIGKYIVPCQPCGVSINGRLNRPLRLKCHSATDPSDVFIEVSPNFPQAIFSSNI